MCQSPGFLRSRFSCGARVGTQERKHVPDYLLLIGEGPVVVDVKPRARLPRPEVSFTPSWTRDLVEQRGWRYECGANRPTQSSATCVSWPANGLKTALLLGTLSGLVLLVGSFFGRGASEARTRQAGPQQPGLSRS
jgi:hypothetical protein